MHAAAPKLQKKKELGNLKELQTGRRSSQVNRNYDCKTGTINHIRESVWGSGKEG